MANLDTTKIVHDLLGPSSQLVYHQILTPANALDLIDKLGAGDFVFVDSDPPGEHPVHSQEDKGLLTSLERPASATSTNLSFVHTAAVEYQAIPVPKRLPPRFVLTATFIEPKKVILDANQPSDGTYAVVLLLSNSTTMKIGNGATSQFTATGQRLNSPGLLTPPNRREICSDLYNKVMSDQSPSKFTLVLRVDRGLTRSKGYAKLFVENIEADSFDFSFDFKSGDSLQSSTILEYIRVGIGTGSGGNYRASVYLTEFEIWKSTIIYHRDFRLPENTDPLGTIARFITVQEGWPEANGTHEMDSDGISLQTRNRDGRAGNNKYRHSAVLTYAGETIPLPDKFQLRATLRALSAAHLNDPGPPEGKTGDTFEVAFVLKSAHPGVNDVEFQMQTTDKTPSSSGRGVRLFVDEPQERDFLTQAAFDTLYDDTQPWPEFTLNAIVNKNPVLDSTAYLEVGGHRYDMVRGYKIPSPFFDSLNEIRALISSSAGLGLAVAVSLYSFEIIELELTEEEKRIVGM